MPYFGLRNSPISRDSGKTATYPMTSRAAGNNMAAIVITAKIAPDAPKTGPEEKTRARIPRASSVPR